MKLSPKDLFAGYDIGPGGNVVMVGVRNEAGGVTILETLWPKNPEVATAIANAINFTAETANGRPKPR